MKLQRNITALSSFIIIGECRFDLRNTESVAVPLGDDARRVVEATVAGINVEP